ncbi:MAG: HNH endonuclease, partial [bacterium]
QLCASGRGTVDVQISATGEVWAVLEEAVALVRLRQGADLSEGECFARLVEQFLEVWSAPELRPTQSESLYRIAERDGWRCAAPGCSCRRNLAVHHIVFRSRGGGEEDSNLVLLCNRHHLEGVHAARLRVTGQAPDRLVWEMGLESGLPLWEVRGQRLIHWSRPARHPAAAVAADTADTADTPNTPDTA